MSIQSHFVIHHRDGAQTIAQANLAFEAGFDGVFLISHDGRDDEIARLAPTLKAVGDANRRLLVGINLLSRTAATGLSTAIMAGLDMVWTDTPGVSGSRISEEAKAMAHDLSKVEPAKRPLLFASVAFKYQPNEPDPSGAARRAYQLGFVPTTSGKATGHAPDPAKIEAMGRACDATLAIASGLTAENVGSFAPHIGHALVATGVTRDGDTLDYGLGRQFNGALRSARV